MSGPHRTRRPPLPPSPKTRHRRLRDQRGFGLLDNLLAMAVFSISAMGFLQVTVASKGLHRENMNLEQATGAARQLLEDMRAVNASEVFARYNDDPNDDPDGVNTAPGSNITVHVGDDGENAWSEEHEAQMGTEPITCNITFPTVGGQVREDLDMPELGLPADLNGDGEIDGEDHSDDYEYLPVLITANTANGSFVVHSVMTNR